jgi:glutamyl-tRNA synthetase
VPGDAPRVRFAPSPTGFIHVGSARTALFNWLVARHAGGTFVLRIEDTDAERGREEWVDGILTSLHWLGMDPDEGPYRQSQRTDRYAQAVDALWDGDFLYACDCTRQQIDERNRAAGILTPGYDGFCRSRGLPRGPGLALRFRTPDDGTVVVEDVIRGDVEFPAAAMDDFVAVKADGSPLFVLANVVDDIDMAITHVIRGEDLLPTTPRGILMWQALASVAWTPDTSAPGSTPAMPELPVFAHLPLLVNEQRKKLSKRREEVAVESYRDRGYLPEAFVNFLALMGWSPPGGEEIVTVDQLVAWFRLDQVNHSPAFFDVAKFTHINGEYIRALPLDRFVEACRPWVTGESTPWGPDAFDPVVFAELAPRVQERVAVLDEVPGLVDFAFLDVPDIDESAWQKSVVDDPVGADILRRAIEAYARLAGTEWSLESLKDATSALADQVGRKLGKAQAPIRLAVLGRPRGLPLFDSRAVLGPERTLERLRSGLSRATPAR